MKKLKINRDDLMLAFDTASDELEYYLDTRTGEILLLTEEMTREMRRWREMIEEDENDRFALVPALSTPEGYREMMLFIEMVDDRQLRDLLTVATSGRGAFRRFKDVLTRYPKERQDWFTFKDGRLKERMEEWLADLDIEVEAEEVDG